MNMSVTPRRGRDRRLRLLACAAMVAGLVLVPETFQAQLDICGCATIPNLPVLDSTTGTYPPGTVEDGNTLTIPLPPDGILRLASLRIQGRHLSFTRNAANTPVTILVAGDATFTNTFCCMNVSVSGSAGSAGSAATAGVGGQGGPGGFRGGDGASQAINLAAIGGAGFGPGGGAGATATPFVHASGGTFMSIPELIPLIGGSGGGGGSSTSAATTNCSGGGGGGGAGALLIAANGTLTIVNHQFFADGGAGAGSGNGTCASNGGGGAGGAIRLVAGRLASGGVANLFARAGSAQNDGSPGRIRLESVDTSSQTVFATSPAAQRITGPTPLANPVAPTVNITSVGGNPVPAVPQGTFGAIDIVLPSPGAIGVGVATTGVPSGTTVEVTVKPRIGGLPQAQTAPLVGCDTLGNCQANASFNLVAGAYVVEARATFQIQ